MNDTASFTSAFGVGLGAIALSVYTVHQLAAGLLPPVL